MLTVTHLTKTYPSPAGDTAILRGIELSVAAGEAVAIIGPSGSGKSTLLHLIGALDQPTAGCVTVGETDVCALAHGELAAFRARKIGFIFQDHLLLPQLSALENVLLPTLAACSAGAMERATALLEQVGVAARMHAFPAQLSGGERQRVAIARALINRPELLLADEPTGNLDHHAGANIVALFLSLAREQSVAVLMVTHNRELAALCDRCLELRDGTLAPLGEGGAR